MEKEKKFEEIRTNLISKYGFKEEENRFIHESVSYNTISINGNIQRQENKQTLTLIYNGVGGDMNGSECEENLFFFDILNNGNPYLTVGVADFAELEKIISQ